MTLNNVTDLPSPPYVLVISPDTSSEEVVLVTTDQTGVTAPTVKISRAIETGASAVPHTNGVEVRHMIVGSDLQVVHDHFSNDSVSAGTAHGATGGVVGRTNAQTLTNKTLTSPVITGGTINGGAALTVDSTELNYVDGVTSSIQTQITNIASVPTGSVNMWVTPTAPTGWLLCQGQAVSRTTYSALWDVFRVGGSTSPFGNGDGSTTFNLPDLRGRVPMGAGTGRNVADSANLTARTLGVKFSDAEDVTLTLAQTPSHSHEFQIAAGGGDGTTYFKGSSGGYSTSFYYTHGSGQAHNNTQPSTVINFIIKF
jgi:microcystin-dependent protein